MLPLHGARVPSVVGELRSREPHSADKKKKKLKKVPTDFASKPNPEVSLRILRILFIFITTTLVQAVIILCWTEMAFLTGLAASTLVPISSQSQNDLKDKQLMSFPMPQIPQWPPIIKISWFTKLNLALPTSLVLCHPRTFMLVLSLFFGMLCSWPAPLSFIQMSLQQKSLYEPPSLM